MSWLLSFIAESVLLGVGLAMDAFSVSLVNGLNEPHMGTGKMCGIAGIFAGFQIAMPLIGWFCVHTIMEIFQSVQPVIPWIAFGLLAWIGGKMIRDGVTHKEEEQAAAEVRLGGLLVQGVATSIDALSVGFAMAERNTAQAFSEAGIIGIVTFCVCMAGVTLGKKAGTRLSGKASVLGGVILIAIGLEIVISHLVG